MRQLPPPPTPVRVFRVHNVRKLLLFDPLKSWMPAYVFARNTASEMDGACLGALIIGRGAAREDAWL